MKSLNPRSVVLQAIFLLFLTFLLNACELLQTKKGLLQRKWQVEKAEIPGVEVAGSFLKSLIPGASFLEKFGVFDIAKDFLLKEAQERIVKASFDFGKDAKLEFLAVGQGVQAGQWRYEKEKEQIILTIKGIEIPLSIEKLDKEQLIIFYEAHGQRLKLYLKPAP
jgi:hypothetical protein